MTFEYIAGCDRQCPFNTDDDVNDGDGECEFGHGIPGTMSLASPPLAGEAEAARCSWLEGVCMIAIRRQGLWETSLGERRGRKMARIDTVGTQSGEPTTTNGGEVMRITVVGEAPSLNGWNNAPFGQMTSQLDATNEWFLPPSPSDHRHHHCRKKVTQSHLRLPVETGGRGLPSHGPWNISAY